MTPPVLIVEPNRDGLEMYLTALAIEGIEAEFALTAGEALDVIERIGPRAMVTELHLPGDTGTALIRRVRRERPGTFIVGLSTLGGRDAPAAKAAGCNVVLTVPCLPATLVTQLRGALG